MRYFICLLALFIICSCKNYGEKLPYGKSDLYYTDNVSKEETKKMGDFLQANQFFPEDKKISVQLDKAKDTFLFRMVVMDSFVNDSAYAETAKFTVSEISKNVFAQKPVIMHFCDEYFKTIKIVRP
jgi:hypothetical protein